MLIYDLEIKKRIPPKDPAQIDPRYEYCEGWQDYENMGISVLCAIEVENPADNIDLINAFIICDDNRDEFVALAERHMKLRDPKEHLVGFNNINFDNNALRHNWNLPIPEENSCDLLRKIWLSDGLSLEFDKQTHMGYGLDDCAVANGFGGKSGNGAKAPKLWQDGRIGEVINYCMRDVFLTYLLWRKLWLEGEMAHPKYPDKRLYIDVRRDTVHD